MPTAASDIEPSGLDLESRFGAIEYRRAAARGVLTRKVGSTEFAADTEHPVICMLEEQRTITDKGGTMRLGAQPCTLAEDSRAAECYETLHIRERHRHRYEFNPAYREQFHEAGLVASGTHPDGGLVEVVEIPGHPWFLAVQCHPEFKSKPTQAHPLFRDFIAAGLAHHKRIGEPRERQPRERVAI